MLPKSYIVFKWVVYSIATLLLFALQSLVLSHIRVLGLTPFLYPMLPAVVAMYEGPRRGPVFALAIGLACDLMLPGPFKGFFAIAFTAAALLSAMAAERLLTPGIFCGILVSVMGLIITGGMRVLVQLLSGGGYLELMARIAAGEALVTLPAVAVVLPVYRMIHRRCAVDY